MSKIVGFVSKSELERVRLIREARAIYDSIFPPTDALGERPVTDLARGDATMVGESAPAKRNVLMTGHS
jgi:hypothetical protein